MISNLCVRMFLHFFVFMGGVTFCRFWPLLNLLRFAVAPTAGFYLNHVRFAAEGWSKSGPLTNYVPVRGESERAPGLFFYESHRADMVSLSFLGIDAVLLIFACALGAFKNKYLTADFDFVPALIAVQPGSMGVPARSTSLFMPGQLIDRRRNRWETCA